MFKKSHRVSSWLFKPIMRGKTEFSPYFRVKYRNDVTDFRVSVVIPKKIIKKRIARNNLKRKILHYIKTLLPEDQPQHIVIWLTRDITDINNWQQQLEKITHKIISEKQ